jgi:hypothetical protein
MSYSLFSLKTKKIYFRELGENMTLIFRFWISKTHGDEVSGLVLVYVEY